VNVFPSGVGEDRNVYEIKVGIPKRKRQTGGRRNIHGRTRIRILEKQDEWRGLGSFGSRYEL